MDDKKSDKIFATSYIPMRIAKYELLKGSCQNISRSKHTLKQHTMAKPP